MDQHIDDVVSGRRQCAKIIVQCERQVYERSTCRGKRYAWSQRAGLFRTPKERPQVNDGLVRDDCFSVVRNERCAGAGQYTMQIASAKIAATDHGDRKRLSASAAAPTELLFDDVPEFGACTSIIFTAASSPRCARFRDRATGFAHSPRKRSISNVVQSVEIAKALK